MYGITMSRLEVIDFELRQLKERDLRIRDQMQTLELEHDEVYTKIEALREERAKLIEVAAYDRAMKDLKKSKSPDPLNPIEVVPGFFVSKVERLPKSS